MISEERIDALAASTPTDSGPARRARPMPELCLTLLWHPDTSRIGERSLLRTLSAGHPVQLARAEPLFTAGGEHGPRPLFDRRISRAGISLAVTDGCLLIDPRGLNLTVNGVASRAKRTVSREDVERGVLLELSPVLLLLRRSSPMARAQVDELCGTSAEIDEVRAEIRRVADLDLPVLVRGETGVGKERVAEAIHRRSRRAGREFVAVNMATISESTAVSTLFGHARGAFTGALARHRGLFERASGGTLFLDEIAETPKAVQSMLLRALETGQILALGDELERNVDTRIIAATDAEIGTEDAAFKRALLHRIAGYEICVPPLRERREDIPTLLLHFIAEELRRVGTASAARADPATLQASFIARVVTHPLPGNVRQLRNIARCLVVSNREAETFEVTRVVERQLGYERPPLLLDKGKASNRMTKAVSEADVADALMVSSWSPTRAAAQLGIPVGTLHDIMRRAPTLRRARDLANEELRSALEAHSGDTEAMARQLRVSERALRMTLRDRGLSNG